ncbi:mitochondrial putative enoyl-CoA hydratase [Dichotomopilus funicola]|uniref:Mitochondrial putative enoyl-CoA hydratase n=1 Tax=Dichotomopilus funicola TaxID=1934379 RepID=A0AAN6V8L9_9PEZI|nr:mitochondrial putative enoyl-CoA hydratase [Dichotomopilus funicola]
MPPPTVPNVRTTFPAPHILLVTLARPSALNAIPAAQHAPMAALWAWYDAQPSLRCAVLTGEDGDGRKARAFCAGADLREWDAKHRDAGPKGDGEGKGKEEEGDEATQYRSRWTHDGFGGLSNRTGKKPIIAAVNGLCFGGGMEMVINCDLVVADGVRARFGLPEVGKGVIAVAGALPRLVRTVGKQRAAEMALLGRTGYTAGEMKEWGLVNFVVGEGEVVQEAVRLAGEVSGNSPDAVVVSREGLRLGWEALGPERGTEVLEAGMYGRIDGGENMREGVRSFVERRRPVWRDSKL